MATKPRQILPGRSWFVTGKAVANQHRFVPTEEIVETLWYCLAATQEKYEIQLHGFVWLSNHYHIVLTDVAAQLPDFMRDLNALISKALNAVRGVDGENFARRGYNAVLISDGQRLLRHCAYPEANPCEANLVEYACQWEGVTSAGMNFGEKRSFFRPDFGLWKGASQSDKSNMDPHRALHCGRIKCPEVATVQLVRPPCLNGESAEVTRTEIREQVVQLEQEARAKREAYDRSVMGMERVRKVRYRQTPSNRKAFFQTEPLVSGTDPEERESIRRDYNAFVRAYRFILQEYTKTSVQPSSPTEPGGCNGASTRHAPPARRAETYQRRKTQSGQHGPLSDVKVRRSAYRKPCRRFLFFLERELGPARCHGFRHQEQRKIHPHSTLYRAPPMHASRVGSPPRKNRSVASLENRCRRNPPKIARRYSRRVG